MKRQSQTELIKSINTYYLEEIDSHWRFDDAVEKTNPKQVSHHLKSVQFTSVQSDLAADVTTALDGVAATGLISQCEGLKE